MGAGRIDTAQLATSKTHGFRTFEALERALYHTLGNLHERAIAHRFSGGASNEDLTPFPTKLVDVDENTTMPPNLMADRHGTVLHGSRIGTRRVW